MTSKTEYRKAMTALRDKRTDASRARESDTVTDYGFAMDQGRSYAAEYGVNGLIDRDTSLDILPTLKGEGQSDVEGNVLRNMFRMGSVFDSADVIKEITAETKRDTSQRLPGCGTKIPIAVKNLASSICKDKGAVSYEGGVKSAMILAWTGTVDGEHWAKEVRKIRLKFEGETKSAKEFQNGVKYANFNHDDWAKEKRFLDTLGVTHSQSREPANPNPNATDDVNAGNSNPFDGMTPEQIAALSVDQIKAMTG